MRDLHSTSHSELIDYASQLQERVVRMRAAIQITDAVLHQVEVESLTVDVNTLNFSSDMCPHCLSMRALIGAFIVAGSDIAYFTND